MPGLEVVAGDEIRARLSGAGLQGFKHIPKRNGLALFDYAGDIEDLWHLRTAEDLFVVAVRLPKVPWGYEGLAAIFDGIVKSAALSPAFGLVGRLRGIRRGRLGFRTITRIISKNQPYRRVDLQQSVEKAIERHTKRRWMAVAEGEQVEVWANLIGLDFICGLRLTDESMRHRDYQVEHLPASLRPSVAAALVWLTQPQADDVFLDPMCGAGTLLIERGLASRHRLLLGGDISPQALAASVTNLGPRHKPRQLLLWDATRLPLQDGSIHKVACNVPFGVQLGTPREAAKLYAAFVGELGRVLAPGGRAALLSAQGRTLEGLVRESGALQTLKAHPVNVLGRDATITVIRRR
jgi:23S rRNA G2445 N2-methylase RlmL